MVAVYSSGNKNVLPKERYRLHRRGQIAGTNRPMVPRYSLPRQHVVIALRLREDLVRQLVFRDAHLNPAQVIAQLTLTLKTRHR